MSSYHSKFKYLNKDSSNDLGWMIVHFDADEGETDSYLSQDQIYTDSYNGSKRLLYGTKWNTVATVKITVMKQNQSDFTEKECRNAYRWLTGNPIASYLDLYAGDTLRYSFLVTVQDVKPYKIDARTVGLNIYFESLSPYAYSPIQTISCSFGESLHANSSGVVYKGDYNTPLLSASNNGTLNNGESGMDDGGGMFSIDDDGVVYSDNSIRIRIDNQTDDLYSFVNMNTVVHNITGASIQIVNNTTSEITDIKNMKQNEVITLSSGQFITSDNSIKIFGNDFNYVWPRLTPGVNNLTIYSDGICGVTFTYRYPIKIGDCAIDIGNFDGNCVCGDTTDYGFINWNDIIGEPDTLAGYGITDAYTAAEIDKKLANITVNGGTGGGSNCDCDLTINEDELTQMLNNILT